jgi:hypothetical protein
MLPAQRSRGGDRHCDAGRCRPLSRILTPAE